MATTNYAKLIARDTNHVIDLVFFDHHNPDDVAAAWRRACELRDGSRRDLRIVLGLPVPHRGPWDEAKVTWWCAAERGAQVAAE